jgi:hypothetical protein
MTRFTRAAVAAGLGLLPLLMLAPGAWADAPAKSGWWNAAAAGGVALPQPTTAAEDLHVGQAPGGPSAYAAVAYDLLGQAVSAATLELKVVANSVVGTVDVMACPTKSASWQAGGNQPYDTAPAYDCATGVQGLLAADGTAVTFFLDAPVAGAGYSLAIVPSADAVAFSADFTKPAASSLTPQVQADPAVQVAPAQPPAPPAGGTGGSGTAPLSVGTVPMAPLAPPARLEAPAVAVPAVPSPQAAAAPYTAASAATQRPGEPVSNRERYLAGSLLALLAGFVVWSWQQPTAQPRLLGGIARKAGPGVVPVIDPQPRGIGRFATLRTVPARPLL